MPHVAPPSGIPFFLVVGSGPMALDFQHTLPAVNLPGTFGQPQCGPWILWSISYTDPGWHIDIPHPKVET